MMFRFSNGFVVTISPADARKLRDAAWAGSRPNAVTLLDAGGDITFNGIPVATGDEIIAAAYDVELQTDELRRLRRELKLEYSFNFVYRGFVHEGGEADGSEFAADTQQPLQVGSNLPIDGRNATVVAIEAGPHGFDGLLKCDWAEPAPADAR